MQDWRSQSGSARCTSTGTHLLDGCCLVHLHSELVCRKPEWLAVKRLADDCHGHVQGISETVHNLCDSLEEFNALFSVVQMKPQWQSYWAQHYSAHWEVKAVNNLCGHPSNQGTDISERYDLKLKSLCSTPCLSFLPSRETPAIPTNAWRTRLDEPLKRLCIYMTTTSPYAQQAFTHLSWPQKSPEVERPQHHPLRCREGTCQQGPTRM